MSEEEQKSKGKRSKGERSKSVRAKQRFRAIAQPAKSKGKNKKVNRQRTAEFYKKEKNRQGRCVRFPRCVRIMRHMRSNVSESFSRLLGEEGNTKAKRHIFKPEFNQIMVNGVDAAVKELVARAYEFANARHNYANEKNYRLTVNDLEAAKKSLFIQSRQ